MDHVVTILLVIQNSNIEIKLRKCDSFSGNGKYLGHISLQGTVAINDARAKSLAKLQQPKTTTELRSFLDM